MILTCSASLMLIISISNAVWIGEEYWTTVTHDGILLGGRTSDDFLTFDAVHHNIPMVNAYIAFWITYDEIGHHETFGQAFLDVDGVCARFVDRNGQSKRLCGGFRVLSRSITGEAQNPFKFIRAEEADVHRAIGYRGRQIAKVVSWQKNEAWYGTATHRERTAEGIDYDGSHIKLSYSEDPYFYNNYVFLMIKTNQTQHYLQPYSYEISYQTPKEVYTQQQQKQIQQEQQGFQQNQQHYHTQHEQHHFEHEQEHERQKHHHYRSQQQQQQNGKDQHEQQQLQQAGRQQDLLHNDNQWQNYDNQHEQNFRYQQHPYNQQQQRYYEEQHKGEQNYHQIQQHILLNDEQLHQQQIDDHRGQDIVVDESWKFYHTHRRS